MNVYESYVKNWARPEGCIIERYIFEETISFCADYIRGIEEIFDYLSCNNLRSEKEEIVVYRRLISNR